MKPRQRQAIVAALDEKLTERGSWCGETHLQKAMYFLQELLEVPTEYAFILYKYGPFSRELRAELSQMRADGLISLQPQPAPYGPSLVTTEAAREQLEARWPKTLRRYDAHLNYVAEQLAPLGVGELERLATALWVIRGVPAATEAEQASRIHSIKPHVSTDDAVQALRRVKAMEAGAPSAGVE